MVSGVSSEGVGVVWLLVPPSRSIYPFRPCGFVRFLRIGLWAGSVRRFCQLVFLTHSVRLRSSSLVSVRCPLAAGRIVFPYSLSSSVRLVLLLVASSRVASRGYSLRLARRLVSSCPSIRPAARCLVSSGVSFGGPPIVSFVSFRSASCPPVSSSSSYSLVSPGGSFLVSWCRAVFSVSFSSVLISFVRCVSLS